MPASGHSKAKERRGRRLWAWLKRQDRGAWSRMALWLMMSVAMSGIPGSLEALWRDLESTLLPRDLADLIKLTAPLTLSVAALRLGWCWGWFRDGGLIPMAGLFVAGSWLGQYIGHSGAVTPVAWFPVEGQALVGQTLMQAGNYLVAYAMAYGPLGFVTSVLMGIYLGGWWHESLQRLAERCGPVPWSDDEVTHAQDSEGPLSRAA